MSNCFGGRVCAEGCMVYLVWQRKFDKWGQRVRTKTSDGILTHQDTADGYIGRAGTHTPSDRITSAIIE